MGKGRHGRSAHPGGAGRAEANPQRLRMGSPQDRNRGITAALREVSKGGLARVTIWQLVSKRSRENLLETAIVAQKQQSDRRGPPARTGHEQGCRCPKMIPNSTRIRYSNEKRSTRNSCFYPPSPERESLPGGLVINSATPPRTRTGLLPGLLKAAGPDHILVGYRGGGPRPTSRNLLPAYGPEGKIVKNQVLLCGRPRRGVNRKGEGFSAAQRSRRSVGAV